MAEVGLILLAAGASTRMGSPKQLLPYNGQPLILHAVEQALASHCQPVVVVLGANAARIQPLLTPFSVDTVINPDWEQGMGGSIRSGLSHLRPRELDGVIVALADQPLITADVYNRMLEVRERSRRLMIASVYGDTLGVPSFFARECFPLLEALPLEQGCRKLLARHIDLVERLICPEAQLDIDTPADYELLATA